MKTHGRVLFLISLLFLTSTGFAGGRVQKVQEEVKKQCNKDISESDALRLAKALFICTPGQNVDVDGCQVKCLKDNAGAVVGE